MQKKTVARSSSLHEVGRQIMSQGSQTRKANVPKASELNTLNKRETKNYVQGNVNKAVFDMQPKQAKEA